MFNLGKSNKQERKVEAPREVTKVTTTPTPPVQKQEKTYQPTPKVNHSMNNIIGKETEFEGTIKSKGQMQIQGTFKGTITAEDKLILSESGKIEGDIFCRDLELAGEVAGNVKARGKVTIKPTAFIKGDVRYYDIEIESGAHIACTISRMNKQNEASQAMASKPVEAKKPVNTVTNTVTKPIQEPAKSLTNKANNGQLEIK